MKSAGALQPIFAMAITRSIQPFIHRKIVVLHQDSSVRDAARAMRDRQVGCVVVSDRKGHVVGIVTDRDIVNRVVAETRGEETLLSEMMTPNPVAVADNASLKATVLQMEEHGVRRIPVIEKLRGTAVRCVGLVTLDDLIAAGVIDHPHLMRIIRAQLLRRFGRRTAVQARVERERARKELQEFYMLLGTAIGPKLEFTQYELETLSKLVLSALVWRLHHTGAMHLISELPRPIQDDLLELPPGPDSTVKASRLLNEIAGSFQVDDSTAYAVLMRFCSALEAWCDQKQFDHVKAQLPKEFQSFFALRAFAFGASKERRVKAA